jgi:hypothetical protein
LLALAHTCHTAGVLQLINNTPKTTEPRVGKLLSLDELCLYNSTTKPAKLCGSMLSALITIAGLDVEQEIYLNNMLGQVAGNVSMVARVKLQALPYGESERNASILQSHWVRHAQCTLRRTNALGVGVACGSFCGRCVSIAGCVAWASLLPQNDSHLTVEQRL